MIQEIIEKIKKEGVYKNIKDIENILAILTGEEWSAEKTIIDKLNFIKNKKLSQDEIIIIRAILNSMEKKYIEKVINGKYTIYKYQEFWDIYVKNNINIDEIIEIINLDKSTDIVVYRKGENKKIKKEKIKELKIDDKIRIYNKST